MQFLGNIDAKLDGKGRVFVPAQFRRLLEQSNETALVLRVNTESGFAKLYPLSEWTRQCEELKSRLNLWKAQDQMIYRTFTSKAEQLELDSNGRVLLQKKYLEQLGIDLDVVFVGVGDYLELWSRDRYEASMKDEASLEAALEKIMV